jgi:hypothetical protein
LRSESDTFQNPGTGDYPSPRYLRRAAGHAVPRMRTVHRSADPFRRMQKVLALAQARKVDVILVTELIRWGRSARFAARSYRQNPNLLRLGANVDLRLDAIGRHFEREIERVDALLELKGPVNQRFQIDFARAHEGQGTRVDVCVTKHRFD